MRKYAKSQTNFPKNLKIGQKIVLFKTKFVDKKENYYLKKGRKTKKDDVNLTSINKKKEKVTKKMNSIFLIPNFSENKSKDKLIEEHYEKNINNIAELLSSKNAKNETKEDTSLLFVLQNKDKMGYETETNNLIEIIKYILRKPEKTEKEILIIKTYFSKIEKISSLFLSLNSENIFIKLLSQLKFEEYKENSIIFKEGDKGEKLYIVLKGVLDVLVQKEVKEGICTQFEYLKYLIVLYLYQEFELISRIIFYNKDIIKVKEAGILTLFMAFRFYKFYKDQDFYLIDKDIKYEDDSICEFINNEIDIKEFIYQKLDFPVEDSIHIFNYSQNIISELYRFYEAKLNELKQVSKEKEIELSQIVIVRPCNFDELNNYGENIKQKYNSKNIKSREKIKEEIFNKIYEIKEIPKEIIYNGNSSDYLQTLNFENILQDINKDFIQNGDKKLLLKEEKKIIKYLNYLEVNTIKPFHIFGELALNSRDKKRTATIISKTQCYFGILDRKIYDSYLKVAQIKSRIRNILYFTEGPLFKGLSPSIFLNELFYFIEKKNIIKGKALFNRGEKRNKIYFVENGAFELGCNITLEQMSNIMNELGGISDNKKEKYLCDLFLEFQNLYENKKINMKICILDKNYIIGLDDMCIDNKYLFDCKCVSTDGADVHELVYSKYEKALKDYKRILKNNIEYVNKRREYFIKILFEQRNSLVEFEYKKIKEESSRKDNMKKIKNNQKFNIIGTFMKSVKYNTNKQISLNKLKNKKSNKIKEEINKSNDDKITRNSISIDTNIQQIPSLSSIFRGSKKNTFRLSDSEHKINNNSKIQTLNNFSSRIHKEKDYKNNYNNIKYWSNEKENEYKNKKILGRNKKKYNYDFTDSNFIFNDKNKILKSLNIHINHTISLDTRKKRNIIPIMTNYKLSLNKNRIKNKEKNKTKEFKIPSIFKEYSKDYSSTKTKLKKENENLYTNYQKNIYNIFYPKHCKKLFELKTNESDEKLFMNLTENTKDTNIKKKNQKNIKIDKSVFVDLDKENFKDNKDINFFNVRGISNNRGFIDFLCFDNWAEKKQFEKDLLNYKIH